MITAVIEVVIPVPTHAGWECARSHALPAGWWQTPEGCEVYLPGQDAHVLVWEYEPSYGRPTKVRRWLRVKVEERCFV